MKYTLNEIIQATNGICSAVVSEVCGAVIAQGVVIAKGVVIDSRKVVEGNLYIAFKGNNFDGHDYVKVAFAAGASLAIVEHICVDAPHSQQILVDNCLLALQNLARHQRTRSAFKLVAVTGSVGKTSTKEMLALTIGKQRKVHATSGNYNNHIGLPLTLVNAPAETEIMVLEMGMNHAGEISLLSEIAKPDIAIITTIDAVHLEFFASVADIAHAKAEIMEGMSSQGMSNHGDDSEATIILPYDNLYYDILVNKAMSQNLNIITFGKSPQANFHLHDILVNSAGTRANCILGNKEKLNNQEKTLSLAVSGEHLAINALAVLACINALGLNIDEAIKSLSQFQDAKGRGDIHEIICNKSKDDTQIVNILVIDETYNASPASMRSSLRKLQALANDNRKIAVLGDMKELGVNAPQFHAELAQELIACKIDALFCVGEMMQYLYDAATQYLPDCFHFASNAELSTALIDYLQGDDFVLCKGSRSCHIEEIIHTVKHYNI